MGVLTLKNLHVERVIRGSYIILGVLLGAVVILSIRLAASPDYRSSSEYNLIEDRDQQLANLRKFVGQGAISIRDYLINNNPNNAEVYDYEIRRAKLGAANAVLALNGWTSQRFVLTQMDRDIADYWNFLDENRPATIEEKEWRGFSVVHEQVVPGMAEIFNSVKLLEDRDSLERNALAHRYEKQRRNDSLVIFFLMATVILISLLLASGNQRFRRNFQVESRRKLQDMAHARDSLEQLSGRLLRIQEEERRKISRELHDGIGQTLTALRMEIHGVAGGEERLLRARKLAEEAVRTVKDISLLLRPPLLDDLGLEPALAWLTEQFQRRTGIKCRFRASHLQEQLPDEIRTCVFRVIQEALNNCEKHAAPVAVEVVVEQTAGMLSVCVEDDGAGFLLTEHNTPAMQAGLGILGMRERALLLGGTLNIASAPGMGTKLKMSLPVARLNSTGEFLKLSGVSAA